MVPRTITLFCVLFVVLALPQPLRSPTRSQKIAAAKAIDLNPVAFGIGGTHTWYSDQNMSIHRHNGHEPATANDPLLGETQQQ